VVGHEHVPRASVQAATRLDTRSVSGVHGPEGEDVEPDGPGKRGAVEVDHRGHLARLQRPEAVRPEQAG
jgi:hypothetical protein